MNWNADDDTAAAQPKAPPALGSAEARSGRPHAVALVNELKIAHRVADPNAVLIQHGDPATSVLALVSGWAIRFRMLRDGRRQVLDILLPGAIFGLATLRSGEAGYSVVSLTKITYVAIDKSAFPLPSERHSVWGGHFFELLLDEWEKLLLRVASMCHYNAEERIAALFVDLYKRLTPLGAAQGGRFLLPLTQHQLADLVGLNVVHVNRVLRRLRERRLLTVEERVAQIHDFAALSRIVPG